MIVKLAEKIIRAYADLVARICVALRIGPNALTVFGTLANLLPAIFFAFGKFTAGGVTLVVVVLFDSIDGTVARMTGKVSKFGAVLDSCMDRYADAIIYAGLLVYTVRCPEGAVRFGAPALVILSALAASFGVSYTRARAETFLPHLKCGYWGRVERLIMLIIGTCLWQGGLALWVLAIFPHFTVIHRLMLARKQIGVLEKTGDMERALRENLGRGWRIFFLDFKRGSIPYDIASVFFIMLFVWVPRAWVEALNAAAMKWI